MASARRTGTNETVATYGASQDYTVMATWESATDVTNTGGHSKVSVSNVSVARFDDDEALTFSSSLATATCRGQSADRTKLYYTVLTGTPTTADAITGVTSGATADIDTIDSTNTGVSPVLECLAAEYNDTVAMGGAVNDATYFRIIRPAAGNFHTGIRDTGVRFYYTTDGNHMRITTDNYSQIQDVCARVTNNSATGRTTCALNNTSSVYPAFVGVIATTSQNAGAGTNTGFASNGASSGSGLCVDCLGENNELEQFLCAHALTFTWLNCTGIGGTNAFVNRNASVTAVATNCLGQGTSIEDFNDGDGPITKLNCASEDATADGTGARADQTFTFVNAAGFNYHLAATDAGARNYGTDLSADATYPFNDDIDRQLFGTWDIGADEPSSILAIPVITRQYRARLGA